MRGTRLSALAGVLVLATGCGAQVLPVPRLTRVVPAKGPNDRVVGITLVGENLIPGTGLDLKSGKGTVGGRFKVSLGGRPLADVRWDAGAVTASVPSGLAPGAYDVQVTTPAGHTAALTKGYTVVDAVGPTVAITAPALGAAVAPGASLPVTITADDPSGIAKIVLDACADAGSGCQDLGKKTWKPTGKAGAHAQADLTVPVPATATEGAMVRLTATATDTAGNTGHAGGLATVRVAPTLTAVDPGTGPEAGGTLVSVTGGGFDAQTVFLFGDATKPSALVAGTATIVSGTTAKVVTPAGTGTVDLVAERGTATTVLPQAFTYVPPPAITTVTPPAVSGAGGAVVTLDGTNLGPSPTVTVDGTSATVTFASATRVDIVAPAHAAGSATITLTDVYGSGTASLTYNGAPVLTSLSPASVPAAGGPTVTLTGTGFLTDPSTQVLVGGSAATGTTVVSATQITFVAPAGTGTEKVQVVGNLFPPSNTLDLTYTSAPTVTGVSPDNGPHSGGTSVTITGTGFVPGATTTVTFGGAQATAVTVVDSKTITATTPAAPTDGPVAVVVSITGGGTTSPGGTYTYNCTPSVKTVQPSAGPANATTQVVLTGTCFAADPGDQVLFGTTPGTKLTVSSATKLTVDAPALPAGQVPVSVSIPRRDPSTGNGTFTYVAGAPAVHLLAPADGGTVAPGVLLTVSVAATGATDLITALDATVIVGSGSPISQSAPVSNLATASHVFTVTIPANTADGTAVQVTGSATLASGAVISTPPAELTVQAQPIAVSLVLTPSPLAITIGGAQALSARAVLSDGRQVDLSAAGVTFTSADPSIASVSSYGIVSGVSNGGTTVTVTDPASGLTAQTQVTVASIKGVVFPSRLLLETGETSALAAFKVKGQSRTDVTTTTTWSTSDATVANVDASGTVTAVGPGTATITGQHSSDFTVTVPVMVAGSGEAVTLSAGGTWYVPGGATTFGSLDVPAGTTLEGYGSACVSLNLGAGGLTVEAGGAMDVSGAEGSLGDGNSAKRIGIGDGGNAGPGGGGGGAGGGSNGALAPVGGSGAPAGNAASGSNGGAGGGPGSGGGGTLGTAGPAGGGGAYGGAGGRGGDGQAATYGSTGGAANTGTPAGGGSGGGGGGYENNDGWASGGGGGGGCLKVAVTGGDVTIDGTVRADGGQGGASVVVSAGAGGGGGGSGGQISLSAPGGTVVVAGRIAALGGTGGGEGAGGGGGGGGSGGVVLLSGGGYDLTGAVVQVSGGPGGVPSGGPGTPGEDGAIGTLSVGP